MAKAHRIFATDKTHNYHREGSRIVVDIDWQSMGCPDHLSMSVGDKIVRVPLPKGFPGKVLEFEVTDLEVYDRIQAFRITSLTGASPRSVRLALDVEALDTPFGLLCQEGPLIDGWWSDPEWEDGGIILDLDGSVNATIYRRRLSGLELDIVNGKACRPNGRWHSVLVQRNEYPPRKERTSFEDGGDVVIVVEHYTQTIAYVWHNFECENGRWARKDIVIDNTTRRFTRRFEAV